MVCDQATLRCVAPASDAGTSVDGGGGTDGGTGGGTDAGTACTTDSFAVWPSQFFDSDCAGCHGPEFSSLSTVKSRRSSIRSRISSRNMPPGGGVASGDVTRILTWLDCGAP